MSVRYLHTFRFLIMLPSLVTSFAWHNHAQPFRIHNPFPSLTSSLPVGWWRWGWSATPSRSKSSQSSGEVESKVQRHVRFLFLFFFYSTVSATAFHCLWPIDSHPFCVGYVLVVFFSYRVMLCNVWFWPILLDCIMRCGIQCLRCTGGLFCRFPSPLHSTHQGSQCFNEKRNKITGQKERFLGSIIVDLWTGLDRIVFGTFLCPTVRMIAQFWRYQSIISC